MYIFEMRTFLKERSKKNQISVLVTSERKQQRRIESKSINKIV
jgi:hypothetical protein